MVACLDPFDAAQLPNPGDHGMNRGDIGFDVESCIKLGVELYVGPQDFPPEDPTHDQEAHAAGRRR